MKSRELTNVSLSDIMTTSIIKEVLIMGKKIASAIGCIVATLLLLLGILLFAVGISENETSMLVFSAIIATISVVCMIIFLKQAPKNEKRRQHKTISIEKTNKETQNCFSLNKRTITCKVCGKEISPRAKRCPNCGEMTPNEKISQTVIALVVSPFIALLILLAVGFYFGLFSVMK